jgi:anti-sigma regulatory factor (Ser/Thr protein kinase)
VGQVVVVEVAGQLCDVAEDLDQAIQLALAEGPRGVVCDLSTVQEGAQPGEVEMLATAGRHVRDWPATPVAVVCPDPRIRRMLRAQPLGRHLILTDSMPPAVSAVLATPVPTAERLRLAPHPTAPHAARNFVTRILLDWGLEPLVPCCCLVVSELVTNSTIHAGTDIELSVAWSAGSLRVTVRDNSPDLPHQRNSQLGVHGRGLRIVAGLSRTFGVLRTADGGKVVWAVMYAARPRPHRREPATANQKPHEPGDTNIPITQGNS